MNDAEAGGRFCRLHRDQFDAKKVAWIGAGAVVGNLIVPGLGGLATGAITGWAVDSLMTKEGSMAKARVFVSFDFDNDKILKDFIIGQAKNADSPFEVIDGSLKEAKPEKTWEVHARAAIKSADIVLVIVGEKTYKASGVLKEVKMAREAGVKIVQIIGRKDGNYTPVPDAGKLYAWNWDNLKKLLS